MWEKQLKNSSFFFVCTKLVYIEKCIVCGCHVYLPIKSMYNLICSIYCVFFVSSVAIKKHELPC